MTNLDEYQMLSRIFSRNVDRLNEAKKIKKEAIQDVEYMTSKCKRLARQINEINKRIEDE
jgi:hypothetical protein